LRGQVDVWVWFWQGLTWQTVATALVVATVLSALLVCNQMLAVQADDDDAQDTPPDRG